MIGSATSAGPSPAVPDHVRCGFVVVSITWPKLLVGIFASLIVALILAALPDHLAEGMSSMPPPAAAGALSTPPVSARLVTQRASSQLRKAKPGTIMAQFCEAKSSLYFLDKVRVLGEILVHD